MKHDNPNILCPRVIIGNRGDILSRIGILSFLNKINNNITVFVNNKRDIDGLKLNTVLYNKLENIFPKYKGVVALLKSRYIVWTGGLDIQDTSGYLRLFYLVITFSFYKLLRKKIIVLCQGAGPIKTDLGMALARIVTQFIDVFVARDKNTFDIINNLSNKTKVILGYDGIFLDGISNNCLTNVEYDYIRSSINKNSSGCVIGFNIRLWYHFKTGIIPYQLSVVNGQTRAKARMEALLDSSCRLIEALVKNHNARIVLISAYQPDEMPELDDIQWLKKIKDNFENNANVLVIDNDLSISGYYNLLSNLDLMIGARLHTTLAALRFGTPSINLNYTLKGRDILDHMSLNQYVCELDDFISDPSILDSKVKYILNNHDAVKEEVKSKVNKVIAENSCILNSALNLL